MNIVRVLYLGRSAAPVERLLSVADGADPTISVCSVPTVEAAIDRLSRLPADCLVCDVRVFDATPATLDRFVSVASGTPVVVRGDEPLPDAVETGFSEVRRVDGNVVDAVLDTVTGADEPDGSPSPPAVLLSLLDRSADRIAHVDRDGTYRSASEGLADLLDTSAPELVGTTLSDRAPGADPESLLEHGVRALDTGAIQRYDNNYHYLFVPTAEDRFQLVVQEPATDASDRRIEPATEFIDTVLNRLTDIFFVFDLQGNFLHWNDRLTEVTGYTDGEIASMTPMAFFVREDYDRVDAAISEIVETGDATEIVRIRTRDGELLPYEFTGSVIEDIDEPMSEYDTGENELYICGTGRDISQRIRAEAELEAAITELERSNAELERFAYVASHDLKEPLRMIRSYLDLIRRRYEGELDEEADEFIEYAVDGAERMRGMIDDLLTYSRIGTDDVSFEPVDCHAVLDRVLDNLQVAIEEENAEITVDALPTVTADIQQLTQLFQNLISNAIAHAGEVDPRVHVSASETEAGWRFAVSDNGVGIDESRIEEVFEIFSSGSGGTDSTGIGLAICEKIATRHGGEIWVESEPGVGSTFYVTIPDQERRITDRPGRTLDA